MSALKWLSGNRTREQVSHIESAVIAYQRAIVNMNKLSSAHFSCELTNAISAFVQKGFILAKLVTLGRPARGFTVSELQSASSSTSARKASFFRSVFQQINLAAIDVFMSYQAPYQGKGKY